MALPIYNQFSSAEQNVLQLLAAQAGPNPPIGQEAFAVLITKAVLNIFQPAGGTLTEATADVRYLRRANSLSDVPNPQQALANIGGMPRSEFLTELVGVGGGYLVKRGDGSAASRVLQAGAGITVANGDGDSGDTVISLDSPVVPVDLTSATYGAIPLKVDFGIRFTVLENTQAAFAFPIEVDGELVIEGVLYSV